MSKTNDLQCLDKHIEAFSSKICDQSTSEANQVHEVSVSWVSLENCSSLCKYLANNTFSN